MLKKGRRKRKREKEKRKKTQKQKQSHKNYKENIGTKLITNTKKLKLKIQSRGWNFKNTMLKKRRRKEKKKQGHKNYKKYIYEVCFKKIGSFFCKIIGYKSEN